MDDHPRVNSVAGGSQKLPTQDAGPAAVHAEGAAASALARPLTHGLFTLPDEEDTVVRAVPAQILALSREPEQTKTVAVPRELLERSRRDEAAPSPNHPRRDESELPVWDAWYGSDFQEEPVFDLQPSRRFTQSAMALPPQQLAPYVLSADDLLLLDALGHDRRVAMRAALMVLAALTVATSYWVIH